MSLLNGCNLNTATYEAYDDGSIKFTQFLSTRKLCQNDKDSVYTSALSSSAKYVIQNDKLTLFTATDKQSLVLTRYVAPPVIIAPPISKPVYFSGNYTTDITATKQITISFNVNSSISILNGCNSYSSTYRAFANGSFSVNEFIGTLKYCQMDNDYLYLNALADAVAFVESDNKEKLTLKDDNGMTSVVLSLIKGNGDKSGATTGKNDGKITPSTNNTGVIIINKNDTITDNKPSH